MAKQSKAAQEALEGMPDPQEGVKVSFNNVIEYLDEDEIPNLGGEVRAEVIGFVNFIGTEYLQPTEKEAGGTRRVAKVKATRIKIL